MNLEELNVIINKRKEELLLQNYSFYFYQQIISNYDYLLKFLKKKKMNYNEISMNMFLSIRKKELNHKNYLYTIHAINAIDGIDNLNVTNSGSRLIKNDINYDISDYNKNILIKYVDYINDINTDKTIRRKTKTIIEIMKYFESNNINNCEMLNHINVSQYIDKYLKESYNKKTHYNTVFKSFLTFLHDSNYTSIDFSYLIPKIKYVKNKNIPKVWTEDDIKKIINNLRSNTPVEKRNKAMVLLAIRLGIRLGDIKNLKFNNINWINNKISFIQNKTLVEISLPLTEEVGNAIIDYIKNGRPKTRSNYIFITHDEKKTKLSSSANIRDYLIETYNLAGVSYNPNERKGMHAFRHSLASNMLKQNIPLNIISSTLGHVNENSTRVYLKVDDTKLIDCCLEVPGNGK